MSPERTKELIEIAGQGLFPVGNQLDIRQNLMAFGFDCGDGWFKILSKCLVQLRALRECGLAPNLMLIQVKEKFGTLRVYVHGYDKHDITDAIISRAERLSGSTCEDCGEHGKTRGGGWITTLCASCYEKMNGSPPRDSGEDEEGEWDS